jgi:hypothetical protein
VFGTRIARRCKARQSYAESVAFHGPGTARTGWSPGFSRLKPGLQHSRGRYPGRRTEIASVLRRRRCTTMGVEPVCNAFGVNAARQRFPGVGVAFPARSRPLSGQGMATPTPGSGIQPLQRNRRLSLSLTSIRRRVVASSRRSTDGEVAEQLANATGSPDGTLRLLLRKGRRGRFTNAMGLSHGLLRKLLAQRKFRARSVRHHRASRWHSGSFGFVLCSGKRNHPRDKPGAFS